MGGAGPCVWGATWSYQTCLKTSFPLALPFSFDPPGRTLPHALTRSLACSLAFSLAYSLTNSLTHSFTHSLARLFAHSLTHSLTHPLTQHLGSGGLGWSGSPASIVVLVMRSTLHLHPVLWCVDHDYCTCWIVVFAVASRCGSGYSRCHRIFLRVVRRCKRLGVVASI